MSTLNEVHLDIIEKYLKANPHQDALTLFRHVYQNDHEADQLFRLYHAGKVIPLQVHGYCEAQLNTAALETVRHDDYDHLAGAFR